MTPWCPLSEVRALLRELPYANFGKSWAPANLDAGAAFRFEVPRSNSQHVLRDFKSGGTSGTSPNAVFARLSARITHVNLRSAIAAPCDNEATTAHCYVDTGTTNAVSSPDLIGRSSIPEASRLKHCRLWNTGSSGQAGRRQRKTSSNIPAARFASGSRVSLVPPKNRGRRECRVLSCTRSPAGNGKKAHQHSRHRNRPNIGTPCAMVLTAAPRSPRCVGLVSHRRLSIISTSLPPASRRQDHTA
jgi:hypothetical protein